VTGDWRKVRNEEYHNLYSSPDIRKMKLKGMKGERHGGDENTYKISL
jgi:hypothetical protein